MPSSLAKSSPTHRATPIATVSTIPYEDEFIELYNAGPDTISLASWQLGDSASLNGYFRFPPGAFIAPHSYIVLFGGGNPSGFTIPVYTADGSICNGLTNSGEAIYLIDKTGYIVDRVSHDDWPEDQSIVRTPPNGGAFVPTQNRLAGRGCLFTRPRHRNPTRTSVRNTWNRHATRISVRNT